VADGARSSPRRNTGRQYRRFRGADQAEDGTFIAKRYESGSTMVMRGFVCGRWHEWVITSRKDPK
jgi:hypothetical protein